MKPRLFIGSSVEGLKVANTIQENLNYDATVTVWNQGIFTLTSNTLDDLIKALDKFDYGIFVFSPDDIIMLRDNKYKAARDNVVFELGLFIGRLGKEKVFFILPEHTDDFHLPSDLLGVTPGKYDNKREDSNLVAALAIFCNQVRRKLEEFSIANISGFENEDITAKKIILEKPIGWEFYLTKLLLQKRLEKIKIEKEEISNGYKFSKSKKMSATEFTDWIGHTIIDFKNLILIFKKVYSEQLILAWGEPGNPGSEIEILMLVNRIETYCNEFLRWELELASINPPEFMLELKTYMTGWSNSFLDPIFLLQNKLEEYFKENKPIPEKLDFRITFESPKNIDKFNERLDYYRDNMDDYIEEFR